MTRYQALTKMLNLYIVEIGTRTKFDMNHLIEAMDRELKYRRTIQNNAAWMREFISNYRLAKAVNKAYPNLSEMHPEPVNICYWQA